MPLNLRLESAIFGRGRDDRFSVITMAKGGGIVSAHPSFGGGGGVSGEPGEFEESG